VGDAALRYPIARDGSGHFLLNQVRFPLARFSGVNLSDIRVVQLRLDVTPGGVIDVADAAFTAGST
jgi:hypothetical protein